MANVQLIAEYDCPCGTKHVAIGRVGNMPVVACVHAPPGLHFYPGTPALVSGDTGLPLTESERAAIDAERALIDEGTAAATGKKK